MLLILLIVWAGAVALVAWAMAVAAGHADREWARRRAAGSRGSAGRNRLAA